MFQRIQASPSSRRAALPVEPRLLDAGAVHVNVLHRRGDPGVAEQLLDRDQIDAVHVHL
jgi:hypothetical protein